MRQTITTLLFIITSISAMLSATTVKIGDFYYELSGTEATLTQHTSYQSLTQAFIPSSVISGGHEYSVTKIADNAFNSCSELLAVSIPSSVTYVGEKAFAYCTWLDSVAWHPVRMYNTSYATNTYPFYNDKKITKFTFGATVKRIPSYLCYDLDGVTELDFPEGLEFVGNSAFTSMDGITSVVLPDGINQMGTGVFSSCKNLVSVNIPSALTTINDNFCSGSGLTEIEIPSTVTSIGASAFSSTKICSVTIPESVTFVGNNAFSYNSNLTTVVWNPVRMYDTNYATNTYPFYTCPNIISFTFGVNVQRIPSYLCYQLSGIKELKFPAGLQFIAANAFSGLKQITEVVLPEGFNSMGTGVFSSCSNLAKINIPSSLTYIGDHFCYGTALTEIDIPSSITSIGTYAFGATKLTSVTIPESVTYVGNNAFSSCQDLTTVVWNPVRLYDVSYATNTYPFYLCNNITSFIFGENVQRIPAYLCYQLSSIKELKFPAGLQLIAANAFSGLKQITEVVLPEGFNSMGAGIFSGCTNLAKINIPSSLTYIGDHFCYGTALTEINIPSSITSIGTYAFGATKFTSITIPESVTEVGSNAFSSCQNLKTVVWNAVNATCGTSINTHPFEYCKLDSIIFGKNVSYISPCLCYDQKTLRKIYNYAKTPQSIKSNVFYNVDKNTCELWVPENSYALYQEAPVWQDFLNIKHIPAPAPIKTDFYTTACDSFTWEGETYTATYDIIKIYEAEAGNDSIVTMHLTINKSTIGEETETAYSSFTWHDVTYTESGNYTYTLTNAVGCDSVVTLHLTIIPEWVVTIVQPEHGTIVVQEDIMLDKVPDGEVLHFTAIPDEGYEFEAWQGCNENGSLTVTHNVNVTCSFRCKPITSELFATVCDKYEWEGVIYTTTQNVNKTFIAANGCDSIVTLHLTVDYSTTGDETHMAVESYEWHGETYTASGEYKYTFTNAAGCDSIITLHLTIVPVWKVAVEQPEHGIIAIAETDINLDKVADGTILHFKATPDLGWIFDSWHGCDVDGSLTVTEDVSVTCSFIQDTSGIEDLKTDNTASSIASKIMRDGQMLIIISDGRMFDVLGNPVEMQ